MHEILWAYGWSGMHSVALASRMLCAEAHKVHDLWVDPPSDHAIRWSYRGSRVVSPTYEWDERGGGGRTWQ